MGTICNIWEIDCWLFVTLFITIFQSAIFRCIYVIFLITDVNEAQHTKTISLAPIDFGQMENWLFAIESTRHTVTLPMPLAIDFAHLTSQKLDVLNDSSVLEFYKLFYNRIVKFTSFIGVFSSLSANDRKVDWE